MGKRPPVLSVLSLPTSQAFDPEGVLCKVPQCKEAQRVNSRERKGLRPNGRFSLHIALSACFVPISTAGPSAGGRYSRLALEFIIASKARRHRSAGCHIPASKRLTDWASSYGHLCRIVQTSAQRRHDESTTRSSD
jgi:hypothetical protein